MTRSWRNLVTLIAGFFIALLPLWSPHNHGIVVHGASIALGTPFIWKGVSRLRLELSDAVLGIITLCVVLIATFSDLSIILSPHAWDIIAFALMILFVLTGTKFAAISKDLRAQTGRNN